MSDAGTSGPEITVSNNRGELRYEIHVGDELAGFTTYTLHDGAVAFMHAEVFPKWEHQGIGSRLAKDSLDEVIESGKDVVPRCPFIYDYVSRHTDYLPHVQEPYRTEIENQIAADGGDEAGA